MIRNLGTLILLVVTCGLLDARPVDREALRYHVSLSGSDANPGSEILPFRTIQKAVTAARPGEIILVHRGTYAGPVRIRKSGVKGRPITLRAAGDGTVTLTSSLTSVSCGALQPTRDRTLQILDGSDYWNIRDLNVVGGILVSGTNVSALAPHFENRALPGRGTYDSEAAETTLGALGSDGADYIRLVDNEVRGRGILVQAARHGDAVGNEVLNIGCGTGGGIVISQFSDGWVVRDNFVHDVAASTKSTMSEGIRVTQSSMYGFIERNRVEDVAGSGGGITTDVNSGWNVIRSNAVKRSAQGFVEYTGAWGNRWIDNQSQASRRYGFSIFVAGAGKIAPDGEAPSLMVVRCNRSVSDPVGLQMGSVQSSAFVTNGFPTVRMGVNLRGYWATAGNTWDGSSIPPPQNPPQPSCRPRTFHVAPTGSDAGPGTPGAPFRTLLKAVNVVVPGDTVLLHAGTYDGQVEIRSSGTAARPILLKSAGDGAVTLTATLVRLSCSETDPTRDRTLQFGYGVDYWTLAGLKIVGGILVSGTRTDELVPYLQDRSLPGRGLYDPAAAATTLETLGSDGADHIRIRNVKVTGRGIYAVAARWGEVIDSEVFQVACGTGPAIVMNRFSDGWTIRGNSIHDLAGSTKHWMTEGIRHTGASMYGLVVDNLVQDVEDPGRGISVDFNAGWNVIRNNTVRRTFTGLSEQESGWGNKWIGNVTRDNTKYGFNILGMDADSTRPTDRTPAYMEVRCTVSSGNLIDLYIGTVKRSRFANNAFPMAKLGSNVRRYWQSAGNTWDGSSNPPPLHPPQRTCP